MRCILLIILTGVALTGCASARATGDPPAATPNSRGPIDDHLERLAAEFRSLRVIPGQFGGGEWNDDVDRWQGRKHTLMIELGARLGAGGFDQNQIIQLLGAPDRLVREGDELYGLIRMLPGHESLPAGSEFLVYYWRGAHDFLFFESKDGAIAGFDWWYSGE